MPPLLLTAGDPAGIGPELAVRAALEHPGVVVVGDADLLVRAGERVGLNVEPREWRPGLEPRGDGLAVLPVALRAPEIPGRLDPANAPYVLETLERAVALARGGDAAGIVTAPVHKGVINDAGIEFTGHTEFLARASGVEHVVMLLVAGGLQVALATTHLPLARVSGAITRDGLRRTLGVLADGLRRDFGLTRPRILVLGLNPHAGENGHLGREELDTIEPVLRELDGQGMALTGPLPADTAFVPARLERADAVLAMYHDQGLPVLKYAGFGRAVNVTLGLPFIRTSVDHGTALDLAGTGRADPGSLFEALRLAGDMVARR